MNTEIKEQIKDATDIVELVGRYIPLRRSGRIYVGRCPWHDDSKPSLQVNPERQSYKCWVCDLGGDVFSFIQQIEKVDFKESLQILADLSGIKLPTYKEVANGFSRRAENDNAAVHYDKNVAYRALDWLQTQYNTALLHHAEADAARNYLKERGINEKSISQFKIGYSPNEYDWLLNQFGEKKSTRIQVMEQTGVLIKTEAGRFFDRFRGRLIFPIRNTLDNVVGFGGRILPNSANTSSAKYVNSPETELFKKHKLLFGLDAARHTMRKSKRALIMEGYTDVIMAHQCGVTDAVAVLGTALGEEHVKTLSRYVDKIVLVLDGDEAGRKKADSVLALFVTHGANLQILTLPDNADPCEFLFDFGAEAFESLISTTAVDALEHCFHGKTQGVNLSNVVEKSLSLEAILSVMAQAPIHPTKTDGASRLRWEMTISKLSAHFSIPESVIREQISAMRNEKEEPCAVYTVREQSSRLSSLEREMLMLWIADPKMYNVFFEAIDLEKCESPIVEKWNQIINAGETPCFEKLMLHFEDASMKNYLVDLDETAAEKGIQQMSDEEKNKLARQLISGFRKRDEEQSSRAIQQSLQEKNLSFEEQLEKLDDLIRCRLDSGEM